MDFTSNKKFILLQLRQRKFCSIHIQTLQEIGRFHTFHPPPILHIFLTSKICTWLAEQFRTFHPSLHESATGSLLFTTKSPGIPGTHSIELGRIKGSADIGVTQWF